MSEVKTAPVQAQHIPDKEVFQADFGTGRAPGSFRVDHPDSDGEQTFWCVCPCGCGILWPLTVGKGFKPDNMNGTIATWNWNGSFEKPTLQPSVWWKGHWHGWLTDGVWKSC